MKRLAGIILAVTALIVGLAILIPQLQTIAEIKRTASARSVAYDHEIGALRKQNRDLSSQLTETEARSNSSEARAEAERQLQRSTRMAALRDLIDVLGGTPMVQRSMVIFEFWEMMVIKDQSSATPETQAAIDGMKPPVSYITYPGYWDWNGRLAPDFGRLYALNESEVDRLNQQVARTTSRVEEAILGATSIQRVTADEIDLRTSPLPPRLANELYDEFATTFRQVMGDDAYAAFSKINGEQEIPAGSRGFFNGPEDFFDSFGAYGHTITIDRLTEGRMSMRFDWNLEPGMHFSGTSFTGVGNSPPELIRARLGFLAKLLPPDFQGSQSDSR